MQRCPYIHEMRERFINDTPNQVYIMNRMERERDRAERENLLGHPKQSSAISDASSNQVGTVVKVWLAKTTRAEHETATERSANEQQLPSFDSLLILTHFPT